MTGGPARAPINGPTLQWAREAMFIERGELARAAGTSEERIAEFETGEMHPTLRQLQSIAKKLDRTLAFFFTDPPETPDIPNAADFRGNSGDSIPPLLAREMRRVEQYREAILDLDGKPAKPALVKEIHRRNVSIRAKEMRELLSLAPEFVPDEKQDNRVFSFWRRLLEDNGYLVFQATKIDLSVFRGLSICHDTLPIILLNGADSNNGKVFTLFHEIAHLANRTSSMCVLDDDVNEEAIANAFAADFLMPKNRVEEVIRECSGNAIEQVESVGRAFKVSILAAAVRLHTLGYISQSELDAIWGESERRWVRMREENKNKAGGPPQWRMRYRDLGPGYVGTIARALQEQRLNLLDASYLLNARVPMVEQMVDEYHRTEGVQ
ncbi:MAG: XRE family transcriptional regulator [Actinomycetaceae bacterium]|nr:XRE family transcriptional regulator [Actinomycetaceae bacterium]